MGTPRNDDGWIYDTVGALCDPIIIHQCSWATLDIIPDWLAKRIKLDRLVENLVASNEDRAPIATDSEALAYMIPASMDAPMGSDWTKIYLYLGKKVMEGNSSKETKFPFASEETLSDYRMNYLLLPLKHWINKKKVEHRKVRMREQKAEQKEDLQIAGGQQRFF